MKALLLSLSLTCCAVGGASAQTATTPVTPITAPAPDYSNYSLMLISPVLNGGAVVLMHNPVGGKIEYVPVNSTKDAMAAGYVPVRAQELGDLIGSLKAENDRLAAENDTLKKQATATATPQPAAELPTAAETLARIRAQQAAEHAAEKQERRQQMAQAWLLLQAAHPYQPPQLPDPNAGRLKTNCTSTQTGNTVNTNCN